MNRCETSRFGIRRGATLIEAVIATVIVGGVIVTALNSVAMSRKVRARVADRSRGQSLAMDLMAEVLQQSYVSPTNPATSRAAWTDVASYNGLLESPLQTKSGTAIADATGWSRGVLVEWIDPVTLATTTSINTGVRRVTVTVSRGGITLGSVSAYRTSGWVDTLPTPGDATGNHAPLASAMVSPASGHAPLNVTLNATGSSDQDGDTLSYVWNFGDGSAAGSGATLPHTYAAAGNYTATVTVYDGRGGVSLGSASVTVTP